MTALMEAIVRPFAPVVIRPPSRVPLVAAITQEPVVFSLGGTGGRTISITTDGSPRIKVVQDPNAQKFKESGRDSTKVHVENEDDPEQFVEFCRADKIKLKQDKPDSAARQSTFDPSGGYHYVPGAGDTVPPTLAGGVDEKREYSFKYPTDKATCKSPSQPDKGCQ